MKNLLFILTVVVMGIGMGMAQSVYAVSAYRDANSDFQKYIDIQKDKIRAKKLIAKSPILSFFDNVLDDAQSINDFNWEQVVATKITTKQALELFIYMRDKRDFFDQSDFKRRITWLYPDDGCFARSAIMQGLIKEKANEAWSQIFLFGNLKLQTKYSPNGSVTWWYHVAPVVRTENGIFVFDPAVEASKPLLLKDWLAKINAGPGSSVSICDANAYTPESSCKEDVSHQEDALNAEKDVYFDSEWYRLQTLGLKPEEILGEQPPWKNELNLRASVFR